MTCLLLSVLIPFDQSAHGQEAALSKLEAQYESQANPVSKAKLLGKLGPLEVDEASRKIQADQDAAALSLLERYRDEVRAGFDALVATQVNAVRHPAGFKELQIGLRETLRRFNDLMPQVSGEDEPRFEAVRSDLGATQNSLIEALFPSAKEKHTKNGSTD